MQAAYKMNKFLVESIVDQIFDDPKYQYEADQDKDTDPEGQARALKKDPQTGDDQLHLTVNLGRILINCNQHFKLKKYRVIELDSLQVRKKVKQLIKGLTVFPGART